MKKFLFGIVIWSITTAALTSFAQPVSIQPIQTPHIEPGLATMMLRLTPITTGTYQVLSAQPDCAPSTVCQNQSRLVLRLPLIGCLDNVYVTYRVDSSDLIHLADISTGLNYSQGKVHVYVSALNVSNPESDRVRCFNPPSAHASLDLGTAVLSRENVDVIFLNQTFQ